MILSLIHYSQYRDTIRSKYISVSVIGQIVTISLICVSITAHILGDQFGWGDQEDPDGD